MFPEALHPSWEGANKTHPTLSGAQQAQWRAAIHCGCSLGFLAIGSETALKCAPDGAPGAGTMPIGADPAYSDICSLADLSFSQADKEVYRLVLWSNQ